MRYRDEEIKHATAVQQALIGSNFYDSNFDGNMRQCIDFKTQSLKKSRLEFEEAIHPDAKVSTLEKQEALKKMAIAAEDLTNEVKKMTGAKSTKISPELREELELAKVEVSKTLEHFKEHKLEKTPNKHPVNIDSEFIANMLASLLMDLINMLTLGFFGKSKDRPAPAPSTSPAPGN